MRRFLRSAALLFAFAWVLGFATFVFYINNIMDIDANHEDINKAKGVVVLTGGGKRIAEGIRLVSKNKDKKLLISGVGADADIDNLLAINASEIKKSSIMAQITLDYQAKDTKSNAKEAYSWADKHKFQSIILITAHYHMPRALMLFRKNMSANKEYNLVAKSVIPSDFEKKSWWKNTDLLLLLAREYNKLILTYIF